MINNMMNKIYQELAVAGFKPKPARDHFFGYLVLKINGHKVEIKPTYGYTRDRNEFFEDVDIFVDDQKYVCTKYSLCGDVTEGSWDAVKYARLTVEEYASKPKRRKVV